MCSTWLAGAPGPCHTASPAKRPLLARLCVLLADWLSRRSRSEYRSKLRKLRSKLKKFRSKLKNLRSKLTKCNTLSDGARRSKLKNLRSKLKNVKKWSFLFLTGETLALGGRGSFLKNPGHSWQRPGTWGTQWNPGALWPPKSRKRDCFLYPKYYFSISWRVYRPSLACRILCSCCAQGRKPSRSKQGVLAE
jgi:hypothetical protein